MLELRNLSFSYSNTFVFQDLNFKIQKQDFIFIHAPSGSGKTSLFYLIAGLIKADSGSFFFNGSDISFALSQFRKDNLGFIFQDFRLLSSYTVIDNLCLPLKFTHIPLKNHFELAMHYLKQFNLQDKAYSYPDFLSGGELQRLSIIRAVIKNPWLVIADEPFSQLDEKNIKIILDIFLELSVEKAITFLISTHHTPDFLFQAIKNFKQYTIKDQQLLLI